jgi:hypothetical protein
VTLVDYELEDTVLDPPLIIFVFFTLLFTVFLTFLVPPFPSLSSTSIYSKISSSLASSPYLISFYPLLPYDCPLYPLLADDELDEEPDDEVVLEEDPELDPDY